MVGKLGQSDDNPRSVYNGIPDPERNLVEILTADKPRFKRTANVVYRAAGCNCLLGFVYPVVMHHPDVELEFGSLDADGRLMVHAPLCTPDADGKVWGKRVKPWGPVVWAAPLEPGMMYESRWIFAYRHIDPEFVFVDPMGEVGFAPAGGYMGLRSGEPAPEEVIQNSSPGDIGVMGVRDVWSVDDWYSWINQPRRHGAVMVENPSGLMNCKHMEFTVEPTDIELDEAAYRPNRPVALPRK